MYESTLIHVFSGAMAAAVTLAGLMTLHLPLIAYGVVLACVCVMTEKTYTFPSN